MQGCLEPLGKNCIGFEPAQYRPESINDNTERDFFLRIAALSIKDNIV